MGVVPYSAKTSTVTSSVASDASVAVAASSAEQAAKAKSMESKKVPNLYFIGEVLDVDGLSGGYNLQIAYSTAYTCATHLKSKIEQ